MRVSLSQQNKNYLNWLLKLAITAFIAWAIYKQLFAEDNIVEHYHELKDSFSKHWIWLLAITFVLMFANWSIEALKWQQVIKKVEPQNFFNSLKAVCIGVALGWFVPYRIGEFAGRVFFLKKINRYKGAAVTVVGSYSQIVATVGVGLLAFIIYNHTYLPNGHFIYSALALVALAVLIIMYFKLSAVKNVLFKIFTFKKLKNLVDLWDLFSFKELLKLLILSVLRYCTFALQFYLVFNIFGISMTFLDGFTIIGMIFLVQSIIPDFFLLKIGIRGSLAVFFTAVVTSNKLGAEIAPYLLWLINLIIPAIAGALFAYRIRFIK